MSRRNLRAPVVLRSQLFPNYDTGNGCSVNDVIVEDGDYENHGAWVSHVAHVTNDLVAAGVLRGDEKGRIQAAAARWWN